MLVLVWFSAAKRMDQLGQSVGRLHAEETVGLSLDADGLHFRFEQSAGDLVLFPIYGYYKLPLVQTNLPGTQRLPDKNKSSNPGNGPMVWRAIL